MQPAFREDCHWLPQWMYVDGDGRGGVGECAHRMHTETLQADFSRVVSQVEGGAVNSTLAATNSRESSGCAINASIFNPATEALIRKVCAHPNPNPNPNPDPDPNPNPNPDPNRFMAGGGCVPKPNPNPNPNPKPNPSYTG